MKHIIITILISMFLFVSCKKQTPHKENSFVQQIQSNLADSMNANDLQLLDFSKIIKTEVENIILVRVGLKEKSIANDFVLLETDDRGTVKRGRIIQLQTDYVSIFDLDGKELVTRKIRTMDHVLRQEIEYDPYVTLPEVIIISTYGNDSRLSMAQWYNLTGFFSGSADGYGYYSMANPMSGGSGGGGGSVVTSTAIKIDFEMQYSNPAINLEAIMRCFTDIPDAGATGSIELFTDIPVNGDPAKFFDWNNGSPGHVFIQLKKQNGSLSVTHNIGFYPATGWKAAITNAPINGKFVNNQQHEFNASIKINLNAAQVQTAVTRILYLGKFVKYDIDDYNCADWALDVFNTTVKTTEMLSNVPRYKIPGGMALNGTTTPQGIYQRLQQLKKAGGTPAAAIQIPLVGWTGNSSGACYQIQKLFL